MHVFAVEREQGDGRQDEYSQASGLDASMGDKTRQEFAAEVEINNLLKRYGVGVRPPAFGEIDFDMGLQDSLAAMEEAKRAFARMPLEIKRQFEDWRGLLNAVESGAYAVAVKKYEEEKEKAEAEKAKPRVSPEGDKKDT